jgi:hypothetical protein
MFWPLPVKDVYDIKTTHLTPGPILLQRVARVAKLSGERMMRG